MRGLASIAVTLFFLFSFVNSNAANLSDNDAKRLFDVSGWKEHRPVYFRMLRLDKLLGIEEKDANFYFSRYHAAVLNAFGEIEREDRRVLIDWFETPLGSEVRGILAQPGMYFPQYKGHGSDLNESRRELIVELVDAANMVERSIGINTKFEQGVAMSQSPKDVNANSASQEEYLDHLQKYYLATLIGQVRDAYSELSEDELLQLVVFFSSDPYQRFLRASHEVLIEEMSRFYFDKCTAMATLKNTGQAQYMPSPQDCSVLRERGANDLHD